MLSETWEEGRQDQYKRGNLFRGLSKIMLSLAKVPLPRIGSFMINDDGTLSLTNRPLTVALHQLENEDIPTIIARSDTYTSDKAYYQDLLKCHDSKLRYQPNSVNDGTDCQAQMAALVAMRTTLPDFVDPDFGHGPFFFTLTDLHQSNIFVDKGWNIRYLIDLEWACSLPIQMHKPPHWLTNKGTDQLVGEELAAYNVLREEFIESLECEEKIGKSTLMRLTGAMRRGWDTGSFFFFNALDSNVGLYNIYNQHIQPRYNQEAQTTVDFDVLLSKLWCQDSEAFIAAKLQDRARYDSQLRALFDQSSNNTYDDEDKSAPLPDSNTS